MGPGTPQRPPSGTHQGQPAPTSTAEREPQTAVAPLNTIAKEDIAAASKVVDEWLRSFTGGYVTLDRLTTVLGSIPIVGIGIWGITLRQRLRRHGAAFSGVSPIAGVDSPIASMTL